MKEHSIVWYESEDGKIFTDELECLAHDINVLYQKSGFKFYNGRKLIKEFKPVEDHFATSDSFSNATKMTIDRSKEKENEAFMSVYEYYGCCCFISDAYKGKIGKKGYIKYDENPILGSVYVETLMKPVPSCSFDAKVYLYDSDMILVR